LGSQIKMEQVFNLVGVLIALRQYHLQMDNMDWIIIIVKNWLDDPCANYKPNFDFKQYLKMKEFLVGGSKQDKIYQKSRRLHFNPTPLI